METADKIIDLCFSAFEITDSILKSVISDFTKGKAERTGKKSFGQIKNSGKLESIEVSQDNIKEFNSVAAKYDLTYAIKAEENADNSSKRVYHVFFRTKDTDTMQRAFKEYTSNTLNKSKSKHAEISREKLQKVAQEVSRSQQKEKVRQRSKEISL